MTRVHSPTRTPAATTGSTRPLAPAAASAATNSTAHSFGDSSAALFARAQGVLPGGVSSPVRSFAAVGESPRYIVRADGAWLHDVEGRRYVDYIGAWGPAILGHAHPAVTEAITKAARDGASFGTCAVGEVELAEAIIERVPSVQRVRFCNSGTEATMTMLRLARAATGRPLVITFDGCYHGHADAFLSKAGSGVATHGVPDSAGVPVESAALTRVARYNDLHSVATILERNRDRVAAILVEPVAGNAGVIPPRPGFLEGLRELASTHGALLCFDEVMTGFRVARGGAQERYGVVADLTAFGKIIGGGLPVGAVGGPARLMEMLAPAGPVYSAGTFSGNPVVMAAGLATLRALDAGAYVELERQAFRLERGLRAILAARGGAIAPWALQRVGSMLTLFFGVASVQDMDDARRADRGRFAAFFRAMLDRGVHLPPSAFESWFVSMAHDDAVVQRTVDVAHDSLSSTAERDAISPMLES